MTTYDRTLELQRTVIEGSHRTLREYYGKMLDHDQAFEGTRNDTDKMDGEAAQNFERLREILKHKAELLESILLRLDSVVGDLRYLETGVWSVGERIIL